MNVTAYQASTSGTFVTTAGSRSCESGELNEELIWTMSHGRATLIRYSANSPLLLID